MLRRVTSTSGSSGMGHYVRMNVQSSWRPDDRVAACGALPHARRGSPVRPLVLLRRAACCRSRPRPPPAAAGGRAAGRNSALDAPLFYQLLIGEIELSAGDAGNAYAGACSTPRGARATSRCSAAPSRSRCRRAPATRRWRPRGLAQALPESLEALRLQLQILLAAEPQPSEMAEPLQALLARTPDSRAAGADRCAAALPAARQRQAPGRALLEDVLQPYAGGARDPHRRAAWRSAAAVAGRRRRRPRPGAGAAQAFADDPTAAGPALLALELMPARPEAEDLVVTGYLQTARRPTPALRLAYVRALVTAQRYADAIAQLETVTRSSPSWPRPG